MSIYISQGTISVHCSFSSSERHLIFVPSNDYSVKHGNKTFAIFVSQSSEESIIEECKQDQGNGVKIVYEALAATLNCKSTAGEAAKAAAEQVSREAIISGAAWKQIKVEVMVNKKKELTGITVPAK